MLVAFEGIDGAGKTTQSKRLFLRLEELGMRVSWSKEPSEGEIGKIVSRALEGEINLDQRTLALLFAADRIEHMKSIVRSDIMLLDRYILSSLAYQGVFLPFEWILEINKWVELPDLIFYLDLSPELAVKRIKGKRSIYHSLDFLNRVRENYLMLISEEPWKSRTHLVDASMEEDYVFEKILNILLLELMRKNEVRGCGER